MSGPSRDAILAESPAKLTVACFAGTRRGMGTDQRGSEISQISVEVELMSS